MLQVCSRLGLECGVKVVEEGRYCLVWPRPTGQQQQQQQTLPQPQPQLEAQQRQQPAVQQDEAVTQQQTLLSVGGDACVLDVYGEGALLPVREVSQWCSCFSPVGLDFSNSISHHQKVM